MNSMIIGNNSNNSNSFNINNKFQKKIQSPVIPNKSNMNNSNNFNNKVVKPNSSSKRNVFTKNIFSIEGGNASSSDDMYNKSIAMLNDRLEKGTITIDEFNKKCRDIAKKRGNL